TITSKPAVLASTSVNPNIPIVAATLLASTAEKENLHPITASKRKTNVLATKTIVAKKQKEDKEDRPEGKKAKAASSSALKGRKDGKAARKTHKKSSRRVSPLPKVDEEDAAVRERDRVVQSDIDSRCYELTVSPLADVTQAYDAAYDVATLLTSFTSEESANFRKAPKVFTTPERRHIYSAFTFTTPSPTSERFRKASRSPSVPPSICRLPHDL
ncbi:hypothetical protein B0H10DRAFT_1992035, partial [Mycena sp. CBHHK59/15]